MNRPTKSRARGRAYECACGEEKLRLTREGVAARVDGWGYLFGECGGGVKLRFAGIKIAETRAVERAEAERVRALPARRLDPAQTMLERLDEQARARLEAIVVEVRAGLERGMESWLVVGQLLAEAKDLLKKGDFGLWVEQNGMDRVHAHKFVTMWETVHDAPRRFSQTFVKIGQEKTGLLARLPAAKRLEVLEGGITVEGRPVPLERATFRQLNTYVRSLIGKDPRGRKARPKEEPKPKERLGLPIETFEAFQAAMKGLQALVTKAKSGWTDKEKPAARKFWGNVNHLFFRLQDDFGMGELLA